MPRKSTPKPKPVDGEALRALAELERRRRQDPLNFFKPTPTQGRYLTRTCRYSILNGPTRGGKTACNAVDLAQVALRRHATKTVTCVAGVYLVFATSREAIRDNWYGKLRMQSKLLGPAEEQPLIPDHAIFGGLRRGERFSGGGADRTIKELILVNPEDSSKPGHRIIFNVSGDTNVWKRFEGKDRVLGVYFDEAAGTPDLVTECFRRMLETNSHPGIKAQAGGGFLSWSATETKINQAFIEMMAKCLDPDAEEYDVFVIDPSENPAIDPAERAKMRVNMSEDDFRVSMLGQGRATDRLSIYVRQWNDLRHLRAHDYEIQPDDNLWCVYDPGYDHNSGLAIAAINKERPFKLRFCRFWCHPQTTIAQDIDLLRKWLRGRFLEAFVYDPACHRHEKGSGKQLVQIIREELLRAKIKVWRGLRMPYNLHEAGIFAVRRYLDPTPNDPNVEPLIEVNPSRESGCQRLRHQMLAYRSHEEGKFTGPHGVVKKDDEGPDLVRYLVQATGRSPWNDGESPKVQRPCWSKRPPNLVTQAIEELTPPPPTVYTSADILHEEQRRKSVLAAQIRRKGSNRRMFAHSFFRNEADE